MPRALLLVLDSVGCGAAPDAENYGDLGSNTLGHILQALPDLNIPTLRRLGWDRILGHSRGGQNQPNVASCATMNPASVGKDTTSGHWEIAGAILSEAFATFERFPDELVAEIEANAHVKFVGNLSASGTEVLELLRQQSVATGRPILYTSADSVLQIAAHEAHFGLDKLYHVCHVARRTADAYRIGRVIARPFVGEQNNWSRTSNRRDFSFLPPKTVLNQLQEGGVEVVGIGKISDIFAGSGISRSLPTKSNAAGMATIEKEWQSGADGLYFANLVDFDTLFGHRRDVAGYGKALEEFDAWLASFVGQIKSEDLVLITADHGNDPTLTGTDHTRESVPLLKIWNGQTDDLGTRRSFADVAATLGQFFGVEWPTGTAF